MILIGRYLSPFVRRVGVSLHLLGLPFEHKPLGVLTHRDEIRALNPLGRVPALLLPDGEALVDSAAILDHLDEIAEKPLLPASGAARREVLRLVMLAVGAAEKGVTAYYEHNRRPKEFFWPEGTASAIAQSQSGLETLNARPINGGWLAGETITQADVSAVCAYDFLTEVLPDHFAAGRFPGLDDLSARANALPAFAQTRP